MAASTAAPGQYDYSATTSLTMFCTAAAAVSTLLLQNNYCYNSSTIAVILPLLGLQIEHP